MKSFISITIGIIVFLGIGCLVFIGDRWIIHQVVDTITDPKLKQVAIIVMWILAISWTLGLAVWGGIGLGILFGELTYTVIDKWPKRRNRKINGRKIKGKIFTPWEARRQQMLDDRTKLKR